MCHAVKLYEYRRECAYIYICKRGREREREREKESKRERKSTCMYISISICVYTILKASRGPTNKATKIHPRNSQKLGPALRRTKIETADVAHPPWVSLSQGFAGA